MVASDIKKIGTIFRSNYPGHIYISLKQKTRGQIGFQAIRIFSTNSCSLGLTGIDPKTEITVLS